MESSDWASPPPRTVGRSPAFAAVLEKVATAAGVDVPVLLAGGLGVGKTHLARVIHDRGPRAGRPFVELHCQVEPEERHLDGKVASVADGTLVLDEVGDLSLAAQSRVVQLLEWRRYQPPGAPRSEPADVRVLATTTEDLGRAVAETRFREDLFHLLQVLPIRIPPLAERRQDISELAALSCAEACEHHGIPVLTLSPAVVRALETMEWPGNVRQLGHIVWQAVLVATVEGTQIEPHHLG